MINKMIKYTVIMFLTCFVFRIICEETCPLKNVKQLQNITEVLGTWQEYQKTDDFLIEENCISYKVENCSNTKCIVEFLQNEETILDPVTLTKKDSNFLWGDNKIIHISSDDDSYLVIWACGNTKENKTVYEIAVLMKNISDENTSKIIAEKLEDLEINYISEPKTIDYSTCNSWRIMAISLVSIIAVTFCLVI